MVATLPDNSQLKRFYTGNSHVITWFKSLCTLQVIVTDLNTQFIENVIFIMKNILEIKTDQPCDNVGVTSIESLMLAINSQLKRFYTGNSHVITWLSNFT
jgi:hypothetical protein